MRTTTIQRVSFERIVWCVCLWWFASWFLSPAMEVKICWIQFGRKSISSFLRSNFIGLIWSPSLPPHPFAVRFKTHPFTFYLTTEDWIVIFIATCCYLRGCSEHPIMILTCFHAFWEVLNILTGFLIVAFTLDLMPMSKGNECWQLVSYYKCRQCSVENFAEHISWP